MCNEPAMRAPLSGWVSPYCSRRAIRPGISCSASRIWWRPASCVLMSRIAKSKSAPGTVVLFEKAGSTAGEVVIGSRLLVQTVVTYQNAMESHTLLGANQAQVWCRFGHGCGTSRCDGTVNLLHRARAGVGGFLNFVGCVDGFSNGQQVICILVEVIGQLQEFPADRRGELLRVFGTQIMGVGFSALRHGTQYYGRIGVVKGQRCCSSIGASGLG